MGPVSICDKLSYHKISWSLEAARLVVWITVSPWNLTGTSAALLPRCLSNFAAIVQFSIQISRLPRLHDLIIKRLMGYWNGAQGLAFSKELLAECLVAVSMKTLKAMQARGPAKYWNWMTCMSIAWLNISNRCNSHKLLPVQQDLQMLHLPDHPLFRQPGAEDLKVSWRLGCDWLIL